MKLSYIEQSAALLMFLWYHEKVWNYLHSKHFSLSQLVSSEIMRNSDVSMKISHIPIIRLMKKLEKQVIDLIVTTMSTGPQIVHSSRGYQKWKYLCYILLMFNTTSYYCSNIHTQIQYLRLYFSRDVCILKGTRQRWLINICLCVCVLHLASLSQQQHWLSTENNMCMHIWDRMSVKK